LVRGVRRSPAYLFSCCTTLIVAINSTAFLRDSVLQTHGVVAASLALSVFSSVLMYLWREMAIRAATKLDSAPFLFPICKCPIARARATGKDFRIF
jgi:hypothetical protein